MDISKHKPKVLIISSRGVIRRTLSLLLKSLNVDKIEQPVLQSEQQIHAVLLDQFRKNLLKSPDEEKNLILINLKTGKEYSRVLENLPKEILGKMTRWRLEGLDFSTTEINDFIDTFVIVHFVLGADFVYRIENNEKVSINFGEMNTSELLTFANLFGELGISISTYFEKSDEPTPVDLKGYSEALKSGKESAVKRFTRGEIKKEDIPDVIDQATRSTSLQKKVEAMKERFCRDMEHFFGEKENRKAVGKKRVDIVESADTFKQYLALKEEAYQKKGEKKYDEMEKILKKAIELLDGTDEAGQKSLLETYVDLSKTQIQQKKYLSAQRNASKAIKIEREAPSPKRLMGECQFGQAVEALKKGDYEVAGSFLERADSYIKESQKLAGQLNEEEAGSNEKEIALSLSEFEEETRKIGESDPEAQKLIKSSRAFTAMSEAANSFRAKHKLVKKGEISPDVTPDEIARLLDKANVALKNIADTGACIANLKKIFAANAAETANQIVTVGGLCDRIEGDPKDENRFERALIFVRHAGGYDVPQKPHIEKKFSGLNKSIAKDRLKDGVALFTAIFKGEASSASSTLQKAKIHFQKALHQDRKITGEVVSMSLEHVQSIQENFSASSAIKLTDALLSIELDESEGSLLKKLEVKKEELKGIQNKAASLVKEAVELVLGKKLNQARALYEQATKLDEQKAFGTVTVIARGYRVQGEIKNAYSLYSWIARVDRNETDLQYINVAWCCLLLGDKERAATYIDAALKINRDVMEEALSLDPSFKESEVMRFYLNQRGKKAEADKAEAAKNDFAIRVIREISQAILLKDAKRAFTITKKLLQKDPKVFQRLIRLRPQIEKLPVYTFYRQNFLSAKREPATRMSSESIKIVVTALKLFSMGQKKEAVTSVIAALRQDPEILAKACSQYSNFRQSALMGFYFSNKDKVSKVLGFEPKP